MEDNVLEVFSNREAESELRTSLKPLAYKLCQNHADALDLIQQTYEKALINSEAFGGGSLKAWMCTIMKNHFIDLTRKKKEDLMGDDLPELGIDGNQEQSIELDDTQIKYEECLKKLTIKEQDVITLKVAEFTVSEITECVKETRANVSQILRRSRIKLHDCMQPVL